MQIAAHVLAYNVSSSLSAVLQNIAPHVDKIFIAYPSRPWNYIPFSRLTKTNPTTLSEVKIAAAGLNAEILEGDWETEMGSRNACLARAEEDGFDWFLTQDADEFYTESSWELIRRRLLLSIRDEYFVTTWYNFWKCADFVVANQHGDIKGTNAGFALRCNKGISFKNARNPSSSNRQVMDCPCYHYGYARTDQEMREKIETWLHAKDFNALRWYKYKWQNWREQTENLHPTAPWEWKRAIRFPFEQPPFSVGFNLDFTSNPSQSLEILIGDMLFDAGVSSSEFFKDVKKSIKNTLKK
jgi:hypothetical protein